MKRWTRLLVGLGCGGLLGCQEDLTTPGACPELCPGNSIIVRDTVIEAVAAGDTAYVGYTTRADRQVLLVSNGLAAGEYRSFVVFGKSTRDSVVVDGTSRPFTIDTAAVAFRIEARDTLVKGLRLYLYRIPITTDSTISYSGLTDLLSPANLIDSIRVSDTLKNGRVEVAITGEALAAFFPPAPDSGRIGIGVALAADQATGVSLALDRFSLSGTGPLLEYRGLAGGVVDTTKRRQRIQSRQENIGTATIVPRAGFVTNTDLAASRDPDLLYVGGPSAARSLLRFAVPSFIRDTAQIVRATLLLTPAQPLAGLPNTVVTDFVSALGLVVDLGAKSPTVTAGAAPRGVLKEGTTTEIAVDVFSLVALWQTEGGAPQSIFLVHSEEIAGGFMQPIFRSTRSATGRPRLRITYGVPVKPGQP